MSKTPPSNNESRKQEKALAPVYAPGWGLFFAIAAPIMFLYGFWLVEASNVSLEARRTAYKAEIAYEDAKARELPRLAEFWMARWQAADNEVKIAEERERSTWLKQSQNYTILTVWGSAASLLVLGRRLRRRGAAVLLDQDPRRPVLYLRPFGIDAPDALTKERVTHETELVRQLSSVGPVIAIGRPGETIGQIGASRMYVPETRWREVVQFLIPRAQIVVISPGNTGGVQWELGEIRRLAVPQRVLIYVKDARVSEDMKLALAEALGTSLTPDLKGRRLIAFNEKWGAIAAGGPHGRRSFGRASTASKAEISEFFAALRDAPNPLGSVNEIRRLVHGLNENIEAAEIPKLTPWLLLGVGMLALALLLLPAPKQNTGALLWLSRGFELAFGVTIAISVGFWVWLLRTNRFIAPSTAVAAVLAAHLLFVGFRWPNATKAAAVDDGLAVVAQRTALEDEFNLKTDTLDQAMQDLATAPDSALPKAQRLLSEIRTTLQHGIQAEEELLGSRYVDHYADSLVIAARRSEAERTRLGAQYYEVMAKELEMLEKHPGVWHVSDGVTSFDKEDLNRSWSKLVDQKNDIADAYNGAIETSKAYHDALVRNLEKYFGALK